MRIGCWLRFVRFTQLQKRGEPATAPDLPYVEEPHWQRLGVDLSLLFLLVTSVSGKNEEKQESLVEQKRVTARCSKCVYYESAQ